MSDKSQQDSDWVDVPAPEAGREPAKDDWEDVAPSSGGTQEPEGLAKVADYAARGLDYAGGLSRVGLANSAPARTIDLLQSYLRNKPPALNQEGDMGRALVGHAPRSDEYLERAGVPEGPSFSDALPAIREIGKKSSGPMAILSAMPSYADPNDANAPWYQPTKGGMLDPSLRGAAGVVGDALTDPISYMGLTKLAQGPLRSGALAATEAHLRPTPGMKLNKGPEKMAEIAAETLDSGSMKAGSKASGTAKRLQNLKDDSGQVMGNFIDESEGQVRAHDIADKFDAQVIEPLRATNADRHVVAYLEGEKNAFLEKYAGTKGIYESMSDDLKKLFDQLPEESKPAVLDAMAKEKTISPAQIETEKRAVNNNIDYDSNRKPTAKGQGQKGLANVLKTTSEDAINDPAFDAAKKTFGNASDAQKMAKRTASLLGGGVGLLGHLTDLATAVEGGRALYNGDWRGLGLIGARALTRGRMASTAGVGLNNLSKLAGSKYAPAIEVVLRRKGINAMSPPSNPWANAVQSQPNGGNQ